MRLATLLIALALSCGAACADQYGLMMVGPGGGIRTAQPGAIGTIPISVGTNGYPVFQTLTAASGGAVVGGTASQTGSATGLAVLYNTTNSVDISADSADLTNGVTMTTVANVSCVLDITTASPPVANGPDASGLDTSSAWRYPYIIAGESGGIWTKASLLSTNNVSPTALPTGFTHWRRVGAWRNNASSNLLVFRKSGPFVQYGDPTTGSVTTIVSNVASSTSFASVSAASFIPPTSILGYFGNQVGTDTGAFSITYIRPTGSTGWAVEFGIFKGTIAGGSFIHGGDTWCFTGPSQSIDWSAFQATTSYNNYIMVKGYMDSM